MRLLAPEYTEPAVAQHLHPPPPGRVLQWWKGGGKVQGGEGGGVGEQRWKEG